MTLRVLNLVPNEASRFFTQQVTQLESTGVEQTTLSVPGTRDYADGTTDGRSLLDYVRFGLTASRESFGDYDLVHANYGLTAPPAVLQPNLPSVVSLWGTDLMGRYGWLSQRCARYADAVVVMSDEMATELDASCHVIPHGVDLERFQPADGASSRARLGWRNDARHVLFPYPPERGVKDFPRAERLVEASRRRLPDPVVLHTVSGVPHEDMPTYMNAGDALLLTSTREGSPNAVKEALACNLPVIATAVGDVRERLANVTPSTVSDSDDELVRGLVDVLESGTRSDGRAAARAVSVERSTARLREVYTSLVPGAE